MDDEGHLVAIPTGILRCSNNRCLQRIFVYESDEYTNLRRSYNNNNNKQEKFRFRLFSMEAETYSFDEYIDVSTGIPIYFLNSCIID